jgi:hypothetical protein
VLSELLKGIDRVGLVGKTAFAFICGEPDQPVGITERERAQQDGKSNPVQYALKGMIRSECPAACARLSRYAASRFCCAPGALADVALTTKTVYRVFITQ